MMMNDSFSPGWGFVLYPLFGCCLSVLLTRVCIRVLPRLGYVDKPGGRHIHEHAVPRGGGIAVILAFFTALGMVDCRRELKSTLKLAVQVVAALIVWFKMECDYTILGQPTHISVSCAATSCQRGFSSGIPSARSSG